MANTWHWYAEGLKNVMLGHCELDAANACKMALYDSNETIAQGTETVYSATNEVVGDGYTATGQQCDVTVNKDTDAKTIELRIAETDGKVTWAEPTTLTARHAKLYYDGATKYLLGYMTFGDASPVDVSSTNGTFTVDADDAEGMTLKLTYS